MLGYGVFTFLAPALLFTAGATAEGLYSKQSAVLNVDGKSYDKLVAKSNQVSIVEFYAPWCGHCKNLKPAYEKAAKGLDGLAQAAAVNCDDDGNKAFCGSMGVQGFPTLKIVKPSKKPGKPTVEDYNGGRTAKDIIEAVKSAIPNNVKRISDKALNAWLDTNNDTAKAILFSDKGTTGALIKVVATDYLDRIAFAQIRNKESAANEMFGITTYPTLVVLPGGTASPITFDGSFSKSAMKAFLDPYASSSSSTKSKSAPKPKKQQVPPADENPVAGDEPEPSPTAAEEAFSSASSSHASEEASTAGPGGPTSETLEPSSDPTASPDPNVVKEDTPKPAPIPNLPPPIPSLLERNLLEQKCLAPKTTTCILALLPPGSGSGSDDADDAAILPSNAAAALSSLAQIREKHNERGGKLFPFFAVPNGNEAQGVLRDALKLSEKDVELVAVNARRGWYRRFTTTAAEGKGEGEGEGFGLIEVESWVDGIRLGEGAKETLPEGLIVDDEVEKVVVVEEEKADKHKPIEHVEL
ncbi:MAG: hypothetical protein Q9178_005478 [Gyalolechia marmorata]